MTAASFDSPQVDETPEPPAGNPELTEDLALSLLQRADLSPDVIERICKNSSLLKSRKVKLAALAHPKTPRHVALPMLRQLFTFDLMRVALTPTVLADIKIAAEQALIHRLESVSLGEKISLARQASGRIAGELLLDSEPKVVDAAFENSRLTEAQIIQAIMRPHTPASFLECVGQHADWCQRREVQIALLRNAKTPLAQAIELARSLPVSLVREILPTSNLPMNVKDHLETELLQRSEL